MEDRTALVPAGKGDGVGEGSCSALVIHVYSGAWWAGRWPTHMRTDLPLEGLEMAIWTRQHQVAGLVHHTDAGSEYLAIRYAKTLAAAGAVPSVDRRRLRQRQRQSARSKPN